MSKQYITSKFGTKIPLHFSNSFKTFNLDQTECVFFLGYIVQLDSSVTEEHKQKFLLTLLEDAADPNNDMLNTLSENFILSQSSRIFSSQAYERIFGQMIICRIIDNFLCYLKDILVEVIKIKPEILKSSETEKLEDILSFSNIEDLREFIIEKKIKAIFYKSIEEIDKFFKEKLRVNISESDFTQLNTFIKMRNAIVHNRAIVSEELIKLEPGLKPMANKQFFHKYEQIEPILIFINNIAVNIDLEITKKYDLPSIKYSISNKNA